jgi:hypothetical protein
MGKVRLWTEEEDLFLKNNYPDYGAEWCGEKLNRSSVGIKKRSRVLGIKNKKIKMKYHKENLIDIISTSKNMSEVLVKLDLRCAGGNYQTIKKYIKLYNIDITHFIDYEINIENLKKLRFKNTIPISKILVVGSTYGRTHLKSRLVKENLLEYKCFECENEGEWLGKPISLQLDHINGIHNDNRLENLRFMCPNCHSQTETFCGKNNSSKKNNGKLGKEKNNSLTDNQIINNESRRKISRPSYEVLINEISELGYNGTGRKYGVSDNSIRKWKKHYEKYELK